MPRRFSCPTLWLVLTLIAYGLTMTAHAEAPRVVKTKDPDSGFDVYSLQAGKTELKIVPAAGANAYSLKFQGRELLKTPKSLKDLPGFVYGNPVLYPTPNRVRDSVFTFDGKKYTFPANNNGNFLHGLVHSAKWDVPVQSPPRRGLADLACVLNFEPGSERYRLFPFKHKLSLAFSVSDDEVGLAYLVENTGDKPLPFGFAFHPWFLYLGERKNTYLTIPATHHMEAIDLLPTGKLESLDGSPFDARKPRSLQDFVIDDVYFGLSSGDSTVIDHRDERLKVSLTGSKPLTGTGGFGHLVVYTPKEKWFCVENQTCSTDAHNLYAKGFNKESNLQIVAPGKTATAAVVIHLEKY